MSLEPFLPITLPSLCKQYSGVNPNDIMVRPYIGADEIYLSEVTPHNPDKKYLGVLKGAVRGIDPGLLTIGDRSYVMIWEYIQSYGGIITESVICSSCYEESTVDVDLREINSKELPKDLVLPYIVKLPVSGNEVSLQLLTVDDEIAACEYEESGKSGILFRCARSIVDDKSVEERIEFLGKLSARDVATIRMFHHKFEHGPDLKVKFKCQKCGEEEDIEVPFRLDIIFPRGDALAAVVGKGI